MNTNKCDQLQTIEIESDVPIPDELLRPPKRGRRAIVENVAIIDKAVGWINDGPQHERRNANTAAVEFLDKFVSHSTSKANKQAMLTRRIRVRLRETQRDG